jgi:hypothetical protein
VRRGKQLEVGADLTNGPRQHLDAEAPVPARGRASALGRVGMAAWAGALCAWGHVGRLGNVARDGLQVGGKRLGRDMGACACRWGRARLGRAMALGRRGAEWAAGTPRGEVRARGPGWASERLGRHRPRGGEKKRKKSRLLYCFFHFAIFSCFLFPTTSNRIPY